MWSNDILSIDTSTGDRDDSVIDSDTDEMKLHPDFADFVPPTETPDELKRTFVFTPDHKLESWASWHNDQDINIEQAGKLAQNILAKREELIDASIVNHLGRLPAQKTREKHVSVVEVRGSMNIYHLFYRKTRIAVWTEIKSRIEGIRYYATWYYRDLAHERRQN